MNALLRKEFREAVRWLPLGWLLMGGMLWASLPGLDQLDKALQLANAIGILCAVCGSFIALGLSIAQFAPDQRGAARAFLMHRGLSPQQVFYSKLIVGVAIYSLAVGIPLLLSGIYLEWIGPMRLPTSARQTIPAWLASIYGFAFYFGGCMVVCGNASWIGTRVLPLAISWVVTFTALSIVWQDPLGTSVLIPVLGATGLVILFLASREAFESGIHRAAPGRGPRSHWSRNVVLTLASIVVIMTAMIFPITLTESSDRQRVLSTDVDASGDLWFVLRERGYPTEQARINTDAESMVVEKWTHESKPLVGEFNYVYPLPTSNDLKFNSETLMGQSLGQRSQLVLDPSGFIMAYSTVKNERRSERLTWMLSYIIGKDRISRPFEPRGKPFETKPIIVQGNLIITVDGMYLIDHQSKIVKQVVSLHVDGYARVFERKEVQAFNRLFLYSGSSLIEYKLPNSFGPTDSLKPEATIDVGPDLHKHWCHLHYKSQDDFSLVQQEASQFKIVQKRPGKVLDRFTIKPPVEMQSSSVGQSDFVSGFLFMVVPVANYLIAVMVLLIAAYGNEVRLNELLGLGEQSEWMVAGLTIVMAQVLLSCTLAYISARHRGLSKKARIGWSIGGALGGFGIALAIIAIYPRCIRESCSHCKKLRRVELPACEHCGGEWALPTSEGIEVIDEAKTQNGELIAVGQP